jgi:DNA modification methylase
MTVLHGDCLDLMREMPDASVDSIVTDPPYGLNFMGKEWDHGVPGEPFWREALRVAKPGSRLLAFGGTRTYHRLACAIEDAGWEIEDCISWLYGSGFPKHKSKLKPAWEPVIVARKPAKYATPLNVDACRLAHGDDLSRYDRSATSAMGYHGVAGPVLTPAHAAGRWPANVCLDEDAARALDAQTAAALHLAGNKGGTPRKHRGYAPGLSNGPCKADEYCSSPADAHTGASRFFLRADMSEAEMADVAAAQIDAGYYVTDEEMWAPHLRMHYCAKASRREREAGLDGMPQTRRNGEDYRRKVNTSKQSDGGVRGDVPRSNNHPTVKPLALMRWLCRLVTPPGGVVLDPFMGSGTTGCAAALEGFRFIGCEREAEYVAIAERRIAHWASTVEPALALEVA